VQKHAVDGDTHGHSPLHPNVVERHVHLKGVLSLGAAEGDLTDRLASLFGVVLLVQHALALYKYCIQTPIAVPTSKASVLGHLVVAIAVVYILVAYNFICAIKSKPIPDSVCWIRGFGANAMVIAVFECTTSLL